jgi:hypothetical protein
VGQCCSCRVAFRTLAHAGVPGPSRGCGQGPLRNAGPAEHRLARSVSVYAPCRGFAPLCTEPLSLRTDPSFRLARRDDRKASGEFPFPAPDHRSVDTRKLGYRVLPLDGSAPYEAVFIGLKLDPPLNEASRDEKRNDLVGLTNELDSETGFGREPDRGGRSLMKMRSRRTLRMRGRSTRRPPEVQGSFSNSMSFLVGGGVRSLSKTRAAAADSISRMSPVG